MDKLVKEKNVYIKLALLISFLAMFGSLYFSEVLKFPPCVLCWYQRIAMYPLVVIFLVGIVMKDKLVHLFAFPLVILGLIISSYHNLLYYGLVPESQAPCLAGVSCTTKFIEYFGFVTIPFLSFISFLVIFILLVFYSKSKLKF